MIRRFTLLFLLSSISLACTAAPDIHVERTPDAGLQPRLVTDRDGTTHLLYFIRDEEGGRRGHYLYRSRPSGQGWSEPVAVSGSNQPLFDPIGRAAMAVDDSGQVHVTWFAGGPQPYAYTRSDADRSRFSAAAFPVSEHVAGIEAGAAIAVSGSTVTLIWHAGEMTDESTRHVYAVTSTDGGDSWGEETTIDESALGVCACCALAATINQEGKLLTAYRSAINNNGRHMQILSSGTSTSISEWSLETCPVSTNQFSADWLAFETRGEILTWHAKEQPGTSVVLPSTSDTRQKHPTIAVSPDGHKLLAWGEADGYIKGGGLTTALIDPGGNIEAGGGESIPDFSNAAATWHGDHFLVLY